jgi:hypothetical protein
MTLPAGVRRHVAHHDVERTGTELSDGVELEDIAHLKADVRGQGDARRIEVDADDLALPRDFLGCVLCPRAR